jgi:hypothetical protein
VTVLVSASWRAPSVFADPARLEVVKWLAVLAMFCDHVALVLFPSQTWLRDIGTFAFPAFVLSFGVGLAASSDPLRAASRLLIPAMLAQAFWLMLDAGPKGPNILFLFLVSAVVAHAAAARAVGWWALAGVLVGLAVALRVEGGALGFLLILGAFVAARRSALYMLPAAALWAVLLPSVGFWLGVLAVLAVLSVPRLPLAVPRIPGLLAWVYVGHLAVLVMLAGVM